jgi:hypothetical protein
LGCALSTAICAFAETGALFGALVEQALRLRASKTNGDARIIRFMVEWPRGAAGG